VFVKLRLQSGNRRIDSVQTAGGPVRRKSAAYEESRDPSSVSARATWSARAPSMPLGTRQGLREGRQAQRADATAERVVAGNQARRRVWGVAGPPARDGPRVRGTPHSTPQTVHGRRASSKAGTSASLQ
jgi:hypothetical protein